MPPLRPFGFKISSLSLVSKSDGHQSYFVTTRVPFRSHGIRSIISGPNTSRSTCTTSKSSSMAASSTFSIFRLPSKLLISSPNPSLRASSFICELCWGCRMLHLLGGFFLSLGVLTLSTLGGVSFLSLFGGILCTWVPHQA